MGTAITAPRRLFASSALITLRTTSTPLISSPWIPPETQTLGPEVRPLMTAMGSAASVPEGRWAKGSSMRTFRPGGTVTLPMVIGSFLVSTTATAAGLVGLVLDELDDGAGAVHTEHHLTAVCVEHLDAGHVEPHRLGGSHRCCPLARGELDRFGCPPTMEIGP